MHLSGSSRGHLRPEPPQFLLSPCMMSSCTTLCREEYVYRGCGAVNNTTLRGRGPGACLYRGVHRQASAWCRVTSMSEAAAIGERAWDTRGLLCMLIVHVAQGSSKPGLVREGFLGSLRWALPHPVPCTPRPRALGPVHLPLLPKLGCELLVRLQVVLRHCRPRPEQHLFEIPERDLGRVHLAGEESSGGAWVS